MLLNVFRKKHAIMAFCVKHYISGVDCLKSIKHCLVNFGISISFGISFSKWKNNFGGDKSNSLSDSSAPINCHCFTDSQKNIKFNSKESINVFLNQSSDGYTFALINDILYPK